MEMTVDMVNMNQAIIVIPVIIDHHMPLILNSETVIGNVILDISKEMATANLKAKHVASDNIFQEILVIIVLRNLQVPIIPLLALVIGAVIVDIIEMGIYVSVIHKPVA